MPPGVVRGRIMSVYKNSPNTLLLNNCRIESAAFRHYIWAGLRPVMVANWAEWHIDLDATYQVVVLQRRGTKVGPVFAVPMSNVLFLKFAPPYATRADVMDE